MKPFVLGLRLLFRGGRAGVIRAGSLALGVAIAVTAILALLSIPVVVDSQLQTVEKLVPTVIDRVEDEASAPLRASYTIEGLDGRELTTVAVAQTGLRSSAKPDWLPVWPEPGQVVASPALIDLIDEGGLAAARFPQELVGEIGRVAVAAPDSLVAVVGAPLDDFDARSGRAGFGNDFDDGAIDVRALRLIIAVVLLFVLAPIGVLIATAARLSARTSERRLASLRLIGLSAQGTRKVLAAETGSVALVGALVGIGGWVVLRPLSQRFGAGSLKWWADDIALSPIVIATVVVAMVSLAAAIAVVGANPAVEQPLGTRRNAGAKRPGPWRIVVLATGMVLLTTSLLFAGSFGNDSHWFAVFAAGNALTGIGLATSVPTLGSLSASVLNWFRKSPAAMLASRRLRHEPTAVGRVIAGMLLIVFAGGFAQGLLVAFDFAYGQVETNPAAVGDQVVLTLSQVVGPNQAEIAAIPGVTTSARTVAIDTETANLTVLLADCATMVELTQAPLQTDCDDSVAQPLTQAFFERIDARSPEPGPDRTDSLAVLETIGYDGGFGPALPSEIFLGAAKDGSTSGGDIRVSPSLVDITRPALSNVFVVLDPEADVALVAARLAAAEPAGQVNGIEDIERSRFAGTYRTLVNSATVFTLLISLAAAAMAATDRAIERRRNSAHLAALGVAPRVQRRAELLTTITPLAAGLVIAVVGAAISGSAYLEWGEPGLRIPFASVATILATGLVCSAVAAAVSAAATTTTPNPDRLRTE